MSGPFQSIQSAADANGVTYPTVARRIKNGDLRVFKLPGKTGHFVEVSEARRVLGQRKKYGDFGPDAKVVDLSNVVGDFEVVN
ncbi:hypothetical protein F9L07_28210 [Pimelobacter simplex]|uniref:Helix-turn-helix domain-containing protein n=1 Tax=Nocardioides simplex TaxID=2045 RepID=A0A7J5DQG4_NOCSI|nr:hypothetical protein [Pimelobacter simplex]KAB2806922.1 hypothetical protein F9L07_28210 [Pimelobacter simplex]